MKIQWAVIALAFLLFMGREAVAESKVRIVTTTTVLEDLTRQIAGDWADIYSVATPKRDIHFISPTPKDVLKVKKADVFVHLGLDAEPWRQPLLNAAANSRLMGGESPQRSIDVSAGIPLLEVPVSLSRLEGDIHIYGNTHYWLSPDNALRMIDNISRGLSALYPDKADSIKINAEKYQSKIKDKMAEWKSALAEYRGASIVTYHRSFSYFADAFGLSIAGELEAKPGIPPTSRHLSGLIEKMKERKVKLILVEPFQDHDAAMKVARQTGARVVDAVQSVRAQPHTETYLDMMEYNVKLVKEALQKAMNHD